MSQFEELYRKLLSDQHFRRLLQENPSKALESIHIKATPEVLKAVREIVKGVSEMESVLGQGQHHPDMAS
jgi:hypothetical protein